MRYFLAILGLVLKPKESEIFRYREQQSSSKSDYSTKVKWYRINLVCATDWQICHGPLDDPFLVQQVGVEQRHNRTGVSALATWIQMLRQSQLALQPWFRIRQAHNPRNEAVH